MLLLGYTPPACRPGEHYVPGIESKPALAALPRAKGRRLRCYMVAVSSGNPDGRSFNIFQLALLATSERAARRQAKLSAEEAKPDNHSHRVVCATELPAQFLRVALIHLTGSVL